MKKKQKTTDIHYPSVTLTRVFFVAGVGSPRALNSVSVVYDFRPLRLVVHVRFRISCFRLLIPDFRFQTVDFRFHSAGFRFEYADFAFQVPGSRLHTADRDSRFHISDSFEPAITANTCVTLSLQAYKVQLTRL